MSQNVSPAAFRKLSRLPVGRDQLLNTLEFLIEPLILTTSLWGVVVLHNGYLAPRYILLSLIVFSMTFPGATYLAQPPLSVVRSIVVNWFAVSGLLFMFGYASSYLNYFDINILRTWWFAAPASALVAHFALRKTAPAIINMQGEHRRAVVAGMNVQALELVSRLSSDPYSGIKVLGFFDDRAIQRVNQTGAQTLLGGISDLPEFAKKNQIDHIYISLPMASQPRILSLLEGLRDTTASIYFVPDIFVTDLIQGRMDSVGGMPIVAVCETPFTGLSGISKRCSDIVISLLILILISPLLLIIAAAVKLNSPGPVIFKQRRYGLDGKEITVYKFRSMSVTEDGAIVQQVKKNDTRVTSVGRFLRRTSLDEFPQLINVLQGRMSMVGPRPHAVAHNELYRKLIRGYMVRHKVKPGITGWAQVNGCRGETDTVDKMAARINFDLDYLRNWSLRLDLYIIARTAWVVLMERDNAY